MDLHEMRTLVEACTYKPGWHIRFVAGDKLPLGVGADYTYGRPYIQISVEEWAEASMDSTVRDGSVRTPWKSGKRYLSQHMCRQEIIGTVFGLIKDAELHEIHEWFRYKNASIYNPHLDPDVLAQVANKRVNYNVRENAMSMYEGV